ncbi:class I SAM-dependent methyltransferase [Mycobacterium tilburgii]
MTRTESDRWDLATSVGATATMVAAHRALSNDKKLIDDPYAAPLVRAVGIGVYVRMVNGEIPVSGRFRPAAHGRRDGHPYPFLRPALSRRHPERHRPGGHPRLGPGFAYRLPWPAGTVFYEIDMPDVIEFKTQTLSDLGADPTAERRTVAVDLRDDWAAHCRPRDSTRRPHRRGARGDWWCACRTMRRTCCSTRSPNSVPRAADWHSSSSLTQRFSPTHDGVRTTTG